MKLYHYTQLELWDRIKHGYHIDSAEANITYPSGLLPKSLFTKKYGPGRFHVINALFEPQPESWSDESIFPGLWTELRHDIGILLLEIEPPIESTFVVDRAFIQAWFYGEFEETQAILPDNYRNTDRLVAEKMYVNSMIKFEEYIKDPSKYPYILPQAVITQPVDIGKIKVSSLQPLVEETLTLIDPEKYPEHRRKLIKLISAVPELNEWLMIYSELNPEILEEIRKFKEGDEGENFQRRK